MKAQFIMGYIKQFKLGALVDHSKINHPIFKSIWIMGRINGQKSIDEIDIVIRRSYGPRT